MPIDWNDPWDDPATLPTPGAYDYRSGTGYSFTPAQAKKVGTTAAAFPWMSPGVAFVLGSAPVGVETGVIADESLREAVGSNTIAPPQPRRRNESKRQLRRARTTIKERAWWIGRYIDAYEAGETTKGAGEILQTKEDIAEMKAFGAYEKPERGREVQAQLEEILANGAERDVIRLGKQLQRMSRNTEGSGLGDFIMSPVTGAATAVGLAAGAGKAVYDRTPFPDAPSLPGQKTAARNAFIALQAPADLFNASVRDFAADVNASPETLGALAPKESIGQNVENLLSQTYAYQAWAKGKPTGSGILPSYEPKIGGEQSAAAAAGEAARTLYPELVIGDHAWTPGRALADLVADPDDAAFQVLSGLVDGTIALKADPSNALLSAVAAKRATPLITATQEGADALKAAGGMRGARNRVNITTARSWLLNDGFPLVTAFKNNTDALVSWKAFPEIPVSVHKRLAALPADAPDSAYADELMGLFGTEIREPLNTNRLVGGRFLLGSKSKMWSPLPPSMIDLEDPDEALKGIELAGKNINAAPETVERIQRQIVASAGLPSQNAAIADATMDMFRESFVKAGVNEPWAKSLARHTKDKLDDARVYDIDEDGIATHFPFVRINGNGVPLPDPALITEMRNSAFELPDAVLSKRIVSGFGEFLNDIGEQGLEEGSAAFKAMESSIDVADKFVGIWKQLVLMRPAWGLRVIAEEQMRIAASGNYSLFRGPLSALAWIVGNPQDSKYATEAFTRAKAKFGRGQSGLGGASFYDPGDFDEYAQSQYGGFRNLLSGQGEKIRTRLFGTMYRENPNAPQAYAEELHRQGSDPLVQAILNTGDLRAVKDDFWSGDLARYRDFLAQAPDRPGAVRQWRDLGRDRRLADDYIDYIAGRVERVSNRNPEFVDAMKTGQFNEQPLMIQFGNGQVVPNYDLYSDPDWIAKVQSTAPEKIRAEHTLTASESVGKKSLARARGAIDTVFDALMPRPSNYLSRSPHFRQKYWQRVEEMFPEMTPSARAQAIADARQANLGRDTIARFETMSTAAGKGKVALKDADTIAKRFALDETKDLLYDLSEKSQFFEATRLIFPFGEAWKEILTRWADLLVEHPNLIRRGQQGMQAARQMTVDPVTGLPDPGGVGMFHRDVTTGEESFIYPMTGLISDELLGVPIPLKGQVKGLNLVGTGLPGIGPVVQFPLAALLPDTPQWDGVRDLLFPFGEPTGTDVADVFTSTVMPAWMKKINQAFSNPNIERLQGNVVGAVMTYKLSTGEYEVNGPEAQDEINRLFKDSKKAASDFLIIRGLAQAVAPTAPTPEFLVKQGPNLVIAQKVADQYRKRAEKDGWDVAFEWLLETYGPDTALLLAQPKSESLVPGLTSKTEQLTWERNNPELVDRYPDVWTMFSPSGGEFDIGGYTQEFERGQREALTPKEMIEKANHRLASHEYYRRRDQMEGDGKLDTNDEAVLRAFREQLIRDYPGYNPYVNINRTPTLVAQLQDAVKDPALTRTDAGRAIAAYLTARDAAYAEAARKKLASPWSSAKAKPIRDQLFAYGDALRRESPDFRVAWNEVFLYEFKDR